MTDKNKRAILAFAMQQNLAAIGGHNCAGCGNNAAQASLDLARQHDDAIIGVMPFVESVIDGAVAAMRKHIADQCESEGLDEAAFQGIVIQAAYKAQVEIVDHAFAQKHPYSRVAFLAQTLRGLLYGTMIATTNDAEDKGHATNLDAFNDLIENHIDDTPFDFQTWLETVVNDDDIGVADEIKAQVDAAAFKAEYERVMSNIDKVFPAGPTRDRIKVIARQAAIEAGLPVPVAEPKRETVVAGDTMPPEVLQAIRKMFPEASVEDFKIVKLPRGG